MDSVKLPRKHEIWPSQQRVTVWRNCSRAVGFPWMYVYNQCKYIIIFCTTCLYTVYIVYIHIYIYYIIKLYVYIWYMYILCRNVRYDWMNVYEQRSFDEWERRCVHNIPASEMFQKITLKLTFSPLKIGRFSKRKRKLFIFQTAHFQAQTCFVSGIFSPCEWFGSTGDNLLKKTS